jgi:acyl dehydratase
VAVSTYTELSIGDVLTTPSRTLDADTCAELIRLGGYTHPLFTDPAYAASSPIGRTPVPGEALLLIMGGLMEQTERFDETTIALVGFDAVRFAAPAFADDEIRVEAEVLAKEPSSSGRRGTVVFAWRCFNAAGDLVVDATARMLFRVDG